MAEESRCLHPLKKTFESYSRSISWIISRLNMPECFIILYSNNSQLWKVIMAVTLLSSNPLFEHCSIWPSVAGEYFGPSLWALLQLVKFPTVLFLQSINQPRIICLHAALYHRLKPDRASSYK